MSYHAKTRIGQAINALEETAIAVLLGLMTLTTFANVIVRYVFNSSFGLWVESSFNLVLPKTMIWALEATTFLFAWLVLFGISYAVKVTAHLGVDVVLNAVSRPARRVLALVAAAAFIVYAAFLLKGAWDYWANFANLPQTTGRWFPSGFEEMRQTSFRSWYEVEDIRIPDWLRFIEPLINQGDAYEKIPRFIPYAILPFGAALLLLRVLQATLRLIRGEQDRLVASHEAEVTETAATERREQ